MATVSSLLTDLGQALNDPNEQVFTAALKLTAMNNAQRELVLRLLAFGEKFEGIQDLLTEVVEKETLSSVSTSGFALSGLSNRNLLRNGYINSRINISGADVFVTRRSLDKLGYGQNSFLKGSDDDPVCYFEGGTYFLNITAGSYPQDVTFWYVGEPYEMAAAASGSGKTQLVATPDLNVIMHTLLIRIAERDLRRGRGTQTDFAEAREIEAQVTLEIQALAQGDRAEPETRRTIGESDREQT